VAILFHSEETPYTLPHKNRHKAWIRSFFGAQDKSVGDISFIFTSNDRILQMNRQYLNHNYFTDVITFDYSEKDLLSGDVFISIDQVRSNALAFGTAEADEVRRVMVHGVLHLAGYRDHTDKERSIMREMENDALLLWSKLEEQDERI